MTRLTHVQASLVTQIRAARWGCLCFVFCKHVTLYCEDRSWLLAQDMPPSIEQRYPNQAQASLQSCSLSWLLKVGLSILACTCAMRLLWTEPKLNQQFIQRFLTCVHGSFSAQAASYAFQLSINTRTKAQLNGSLRSALDKADGCL